MRKFRPASRPGSIRSRSCSICAASMQAGAQKGRVPAWFSASAPDGRRQRC